MNTLKAPTLKTYLVPILALVVIILIVPLVILPQLSRIRDKNIEVKKSRERLEKLIQKRDALAEIDEEDESQKRFEVEKSVPGDKKLAPLIIGIRNLAGTAGLRILEMNFKPGKVATESAAVAETKTKDKTKASVATGEEKDRLTFTVKLEDSLDTALDKIKILLTSLEKTKRLLGVSSISTARKLEGKTYTFDLEISTPVKQVKSCTDTAGSGKASSCPDIVAEPLPSLSEDNKKMLDFLAKLEDNTNIIVLPGPTCLADPFVGAPCL